MPLPTTAVVGALQERCSALPPAAAANGAEVQGAASPPTGPAADRATEEGGTAPPPAGPADGATKEQGTAPSPVAPADGTAEEQGSVLQPGAEERLPEPQPAAPGGGLAGEQSPLRPPAAVVGGTTAEQRSAPLPAASGAGVAAGQLATPLPVASCSATEEGEGESCAAGEQVDVGLRSHRSCLRAKAVEELKEGSAAEAIERVRARLLADDERIKAKEEYEVAQIAHVRDANDELAARTQEVQDTLHVEAEACKDLKTTEQRHREAINRTAARRVELQRAKEVLVILEMKAAKRAADEKAALEVSALQDMKRRKIEELEKVVADSQKAAEEMRQRELDARNAMRKLIKEEKQLVRLGKFSRRQRHKLLASGAILNSNTESKAVAADEGGVRDDTSQAEAPVRVKREVMQAFAPPRDEPVMVMVIEDDSQ